MKFKFLSVCFGNSKNSSLCQQTLSLSFLSCWTSFFSFFFSSLFFSLSFLLSPLETNLRRRDRDIPPSVFLSCYRKEESSGERKNLRENSREKSGKREDEGIEWLEWKSRLNSFRRRRRGRRREFMKTKERQRKGKGRDKRRIERKEGWEFSNFRL